jgi:acyl-CoA synthetase (NDP forming)
VTVTSTVSRSGTLGESSTRDLLAPLDLPFVTSVQVTNCDEAVETALRFGGSVVLKALSDKVIHKSDAGLVELKLSGAESVRGAYERLAGRIAALGLTDAGIVVQDMAPEGTDLFVGWNRDATFGPILIVGLGGVTVELFRDVARHPAPVTAEQAAAMLDSLVCSRLLHGFRGAAAVDTAQFCRLVARVSELAAASPEIAELDLNPVRILPDGRCLVLDASAAMTPVQKNTSSTSGSVDLTGLFRPRSIAVVGASRTPDRPGGKVIRALQRNGFGGPVYPVNPAGGEIDGLPVMRSLDDIVEVPDLVCIALPAEASITAVRECAARGVRAVIVFASGFGEVGTAGAALDAELQAAIAGSRTVLCGPNTIGIVSAHHKMAATFSQAVDRFPASPSGVCLVAQSGAVAGSLVSREIADGYSIGDWVTVGNQSDLDVADYISYLVGLETTRSIAVFLEGVTDGSSFRRSLHEARESGIPVTVFKTGVTDAGQRAVASHSGALAGSHDAYRAVLMESGAVQVEEMTQLLEVASTLAQYPQLRGRRSVVITTSGGAGSATVDLLTVNGLETAQFTEATAQTLAMVLPRFASVANPLDITAEGAFTAGLFAEVINAVAVDPNVDTVCVVLTSITGDDAVRVANEVVAAAAQSEVPILVTWLVARPLAESGMSTLAAAGIRVFTEPARMASALRHLTKGTSHV